MSISISIIGAGGFRWGPLNIRDILLDPMLAGSTVTLWDADASALDLVYAYGRFVESCTLHGSRVHRACCEEEALAGQDVIVLTLNVGGLEAMRKEMDWLQACGGGQPVGDTVGAAGYSRALRHLPVMLQLAEQAARTSPGALLLNTTNPLTMLTQALWQRCALPVIGVCHEPHHVLHRLKGLFNIKNDDDIQMTVWGHNHCSWFLDLAIRDQDLRHGWQEAGGTVGSEPVTPDLPPPSPQEMQAIWNVLSHLYRLVHGQAPAGKAAMALYGITLNFYVFSRSGFFPACRPRHFSEFFRHWITPQTQWGQLLGVPLTTVRSRMLYRQRQRDLVTGALETQDRSGLVVSDREIGAVIRSYLCDTDESFFVNTSSMTHSCPPGFVHEYRVPVHRSSLAAPPEPPDALWPLHRLIHQQYQDWIEATLCQDQDRMREVLQRDPASSLIKDKDHLLQGILWLNQRISSSCAA